MKTMDIMSANKLFKTLLMHHRVILSSAFSLSGEQHWRNAL
ncbi:protein YdgV [Dryocola clanedunensis]